MPIYYVRTDGNNGNAGTSDSSGGAWATISYAATHVAAGDTIMVRHDSGNAAASTYPTSGLDFTEASYFIPTAGDTTSGWVRWIGYNGIPTIGLNGLGWYQSSGQWLEGLYLVATGSSNGSLGMINNGNATTFNTIKNCIFNLNNQASLIGMQIGLGSVRGTEVWGGTNSPTYSAGSYGIQTMAYGCLVDGCDVHHCLDHGIYASGQGGRVINSLMRNNVGSGIYSYVNDTITNILTGNTLDSNGGDGITVAKTAGISWCLIFNNIMTSNGGYGLSVADGSTSTNDARKIAANFNCYGASGAANTSGTVNNISLGDNDLNVDPQYTGGSPYDYTPTNTALQGAAFPETLP